MNLISFNLFFNNKKKKLILYHLYYNKLIIKFFKVNFHVLNFRALLNLK